MSKRTKTKSTNGKGVLDAVDTLATTGKPRGRKGQVAAYHASKGLKGSLVDKATGGRMA